MAIVSLELSLLYPNISSISGIIVFSFHMRCRHQDPELRWETIYKLYYSYNSYSAVAWAQPNRDRGRPDGLAIESDSQLPISFADYLDQLICGPP
jgi:hypothetical protein